MHAVNNGRRPPKSIHPGRRPRKREKDEIYAAVLHLRRLGIQCWRQPGGIHLVSRSGVSLDDQALIEYAAKRRRKPVQLDLFAAA